MFRTALTAWMPSVFGTGRASTKFIHHILALLLTAALAVATASCSSASVDEPFPRPDEGPTYTIGLLLQTSSGSGRASSRTAGQGLLPGAVPAFGTHSKASRADDPDPDYLPGSGIENYIDFTFGGGGDIRVALFTTDAADTPADAMTGGSWLFTPEKPAISPLTDNLYYIYFEIPAEVRDAINAAGFKVVIMANWRGNYPALTAGSTLSGLFEQSAPILYSDSPEAAEGTLRFPQPELTKADKIAMFGVHEYAAVEVSPGVTYDSLEPIDLIRALAKVELWSADDSDHAYKIRSVSLNRYTTQAMPLPSGVYSEKDYVKGNYWGDYVGYPSLPPAPDNEHYPYESSGNVQIHADSEGHHIIYIPEFPNAGRTDSDCTRLIVTYDDGKEFYIDFKYYNEDDPYRPAGVKPGTRFDILRNHWYQFEVSRSSSEISVRLREWNYLEEDEIII